MRIAALIRRPVATLLVALACHGTQAREPLPPPAVPPGKAAPSLQSIKLANPGFESTQPGRLGAPDGWWVIQHAGVPSYRFTVDTASKKSGETSLRIDNIGPEPFGSIFQTVNAAPLRGKTLRLAAWLRTEGTTGNHFGNGASLYLHATRGGYARADSNMRKNGVHGTTGWTRYEIALEVPDEADRIELGLSLLGPGSVWLDDVTLDVVAVRGASAAPSGTPARSGLPRF